MAELIEQPKANVSLYKLVARGITPAVLLLGLLLLALYHFNIVLSTTQTQNDLLQGITAMSQDRLEVDFQRDAGINRPEMIYNALPLISYTEVNSTISIDGHVQNLWNNLHGYSFDARHNQIFATTSGSGWQVTQVVQLVNDHTMTVTYQFTARPVGTASPRRVTLDIAHVHVNTTVVDNTTPRDTAMWYYPAVQGATFTAEELPLVVQNPRTPYDPNAPQSFAPMGQTTVQVSGPALASTPITIDDAAGAVVGQQQEWWASQITTHYALTDPTVNQFISLGTETITFTPFSGNAGTPVALPLPASGS